MGISLAGSRFDEGGKVSRWESGLVWWSLPRNTKGLNGLVAPFECRVENDDCRMQGGPGGRLRQARRVCPAERRMITNYE